MIRDGDFSKILMTLLMLTIISLLSCVPKINSEPPDIKVNPVAVNEAQNSGGLPPLVIDTSEPLLLDEPTEEEKVFAAANTQAAKENTACFVCHGNYRTEFIVNSHTQANIGCFHCHGESSAHQNDENNTTPPDILYASDKIEPLCRNCHTAHVISPSKIIANYLKKKSEKKNTSCKGCHESDDVPPQKVVDRWKELNPEEIEPENIVCTDCHGEHRMKVRTIIWDKKTGKLLRTNRGD